MKKYLGSSMTIFVAIVLPIFAFFPPVAGIYLLITVPGDPAVVMLMLGGVLCCIVCTIYLLQVKNQLYSWGKFEKDCVCVKTLFSKKFLLKYKNCHEIGIGSYLHDGVSGASKTGIRYYFIYLTTEHMELKSKNAINLWKPSKTRVKVVFDQALYEYLLSVLPKDKAKDLKLDHCRCFGIKK